jgi:cold shock CspA family protein
MNAEFLEGTIANYNIEKRYGFIAIEGYGDLFFFHSSLSPSTYEPARGDAVRCVAGTDRNGRPAAVKVMPLFE